MRALKAIVDIRKQEAPAVVLLFLFFFLVIAVFQILKPLKNGLFIELFGADMELYAKLLNIVVAAAGVVFFTFLFKKLPRQRLMYVLCAFFVIALVALTQVLPEKSPLPVWAFYLLGDLESTLMVSAFWAYATDVSSASQAKRLFGAIGAGGVIGGWVGIAYARALLTTAGMNGLLYLCAGLMAVVMVATFLLEGIVRRSSAFAERVREAPAAESGGAKPFSMAEAIDGARLVLRSRYLTAILLIMASYEIASQVMDYQFKRGTEGLAGVEATQAFMTNVYFYANTLSVVVQFFLVSLIMRKLGIVPALLVLPLAIVGSSIAFLIMPTLWVGSLLVISDNGLNYSIQQTARETLYVVTTPEEKYNARAFTTMFMQRFAKGIAIFLVMALSTLSIAPRYLSIVTLAIVAIMAFSGIYAGRRFTEKSALEDQAAA